MLRLGGSIMWEHVIERLKTPIQTSAASTGMGVMMVAAQLVGSTMT